MEILLVSLTNLIVLPKLLGPYERNQIEAIKWTSMLLPHESVVKKFCYFLSYQCPFSTPVKQQFEVQNINIKSSTIKLWRHRIGL
jgi:hypothetical protein